MENTALATFLINISSIDNWYQYFSGDIAVIGRYCAREGKNFVKNSYIISEILLALPDVDVYNTRIWAKLT